VAIFKVLFRNLAEYAEENHEKSQDIRSQCLDFNPVPLRFEAWRLTS
jgi:hypothetical protein